MRVKVADRFGPYEIVRPISSGGMGEVYLARDTRLERSRVCSGTKAIASAGSNQGVHSKGDDMGRAVSSPRNSELTTEQPLEVSAEDTRDAAWMRTIPASARPPHKSPRSPWP